MVTEQNPLDDDEKSKTCLAEKPVWVEETFGYILANEYCHKVYDRIKGASEEDLPGIVAGYKDTEEQFVPVFLIDISTVRESEDLGDFLMKIINISEKKAREILREYKVMKAGEKYLGNEEAIKEALDETFDRILK